MIRSVIDVALRQLLMHEVNSGMVWWGARGLGLQGLSMVRCCSAVAQKSGEESNIANRKVELEPRMTKRRRHTENHVSLAGI
jgi:hypothetical protein